MSKVGTVAKLAAIEPLYLFFNNCSTMIVSREMKGKNMKKIKTWFIFWVLCSNYSIAQEMPYEAIISCGMNGHINILACFAGGSRGVDTEMKLTNNGRTGIYKAYNFNQSGGREMRDGYHLPLTEKFSLKVQNAEETLILEVKIIDKKSGKVLFQDQASQYGVINVGN